jgi:hypothetical protein
MELFVVKNVKSLEVLKGFNNKMDAKTFRKEKNPKAEDGSEIMEHTVSPGRDHDRARSKAFTIPGRRNRE